LRDGENARKRKRQRGQQTRNPLHVSSRGAACVIPATTRDKDNTFNFPLTIRHTFAAVRQNRRLVPAGTAPASPAIFMTKVIRTAGL
jgi:hypothetical protein